MKMDKNNVEDPIENYHQQYGGESADVAPQESKKPIYKKWWFWVIIFIVAGAIFGGSGGNGSDTSSDKEGSQVEASALSPEEQFSKDNDISVDLATNILAACESIGITSDKMSGFGPYEDWSNGKRYTFDYADYNFLVYLNQDETVNSINSGTIKFFENGAAVSNVNDKIVSSTQRGLIIISAQEDVENNLKAPTTAEFPGEVLEADQWNVSRDGTTYVITSYVDAQNSFGAMIRSNFQVTYEWDGSTDTVPTLTDIVIQ